MLRQVGYDEYTPERWNASHVKVAQGCVMKSLIRVAFTLAVCSRVITVTSADAPQRLMQTLMMAVVVLCWRNISTEMIGEMIY
jgi:hypothetical protein